MLELFDAFNVLKKLYSGNTHTVRKLHALMYDMYKQMIYE